MPKRQAEMLREDNRMKLKLSKKADDAIMNFWAAVLFTVILGIFLIWLIRSVVKNVP